MSASSSSGGSGGGVVSGPCGACKFLRRKCAPGCIFAPYFDSEQGATHFAAVHKVFGASNMSKLLQHVPINKRLDAVVTICYEAQARLRDPVYGCVSSIFALQRQVVNLQAEVSYLQAHLAALELPIPPPPPAMPLAPRPLTMAGLPPPTADLPISFDLETLFDPLVQPAWAIPQVQLGFPQYGGTLDLQALAGGQLQRQGTTGSMAPPSTSALPPPPPPRSGCD